MKCALCYRLGALQHIQCLHSAFVGNGTSLQHRLMSLSSICLVFLFSIHNLDIDTYNSSMVIFCPASWLPLYHLVSTQTRLTAYCITSFPSMESFPSTMLPCHKTFHHQFYLKTLQTLKLCTLISHVHLPVTLMAWGSAVQVSLRILSRLSAGAWCAKQTKRAHATHLCVVTNYPSCTFLSAFTRSSNQIISSELLVLCVYYLPHWSSWSA